MTFSEFVSWVQIFDFECITFTVLTHIATIGAGNTAHRQLEEVEGVHLAVVKTRRCHLI